MSIYIRCLGTESYVLDITQEQCDTKLESRRLEFGISLLKGDIWHIQQTKIATLGCCWKVLMKVAKVFAGTMGLIAEVSMGVILFKKQTFERCLCLLNRIRPLVVRQMIATLLLSFLQLLSLATCPL